MTNASDGARYWDKHAKNYDRSMLLLGRPVPRMVALAANAVRETPHVLEVAAGTGLVTLELARAAKSLVATDYSTAMVEMLAQKMREASLTNVRCEQADIYALPFDPETFDSIVAANVFHLVPDLRGAVRALRRVMKPGGCLVAPTYCHDETLISRATSRLLALSGFPGHRRFTLHRLRTALESEGLRVVREELLPGVIPIGYLEGVFDS